MSALKLPGPVVSPEWLLEHVSHPQLVVLDASMKVPSAKPVMEEKPDPTAGEQIVGTRVFDFDKRICDRTSTLPHMMPTPAQFEDDVRALGVNRDSVIVVYDRLGTWASPRAYWMWKAMGHEAVAVLDGGFPAWLAAKYPTVPKTPFAGVAGDFVAQPKAGMFCDAEHVARALSDTAHSAVIDARSRGRFAGTEPEPRAGLRPGHMPNAKNLPFGEVQREGRMLDTDALRAKFEAVVTPDQSLVFSCGSGVTACIVALAAELAGYQRLSVYDGSWSEWGDPASKRPVETS